MKKRFLAGLLIALAVYLLAWPVELDPLAWSPPPAPADDPRFAENDRLAALERIAGGIGTGPEAVAIDAQGRLVTGFIDGRVMRFSADGREGEVLADTGGRPLGIAFAGNGDVIVADAVRGLLRIIPGQGLRVVARDADGVPLGFTDDVDVSSADIAYYSDASVRWGEHEVMQDVLESRPHGRLLATDLNSGETTVLVPALHFANGVALGPDERYVLVTETTRYRVLRYWLDGPRKGELETFIDNLPGMPDNITYNGRDRFWLALYTPRNSFLDLTLPHPFLRKVVWRVPQALRPQAAEHAFVLGLDHDGQVTHNLQDPGPGTYAPITSAREGDGYLYFGSLIQPSLARLPLAAIAR